MTSKRLTALLDERPVIVATVGMPGGNGGAWNGQRATVDLDSIEPGDPLPRPDAGGLALVARSVTDLRRAITLAGLLPPVRRLIVAVVESSWRHPLDAPNLTQVWRHRVKSLRMERLPGHGWVVVAEFTEETPAGRLLATMARPRRPGRGAPDLRVALAGQGCAHWLPGEPGVALTSAPGPLAEPHDPLAADLVLRVVTADDPPLWTDNRAVVVDRSAGALMTWRALDAPDGLERARALPRSVLDVDHVPPIDELAVNPAGFRLGPTLGVARLAQHRDGWRVEGAGPDPVVIDPSGVVTESDVGRLRPVRAVTVDWGRHTGPVAAVRAVAGLAAAGVPLLASHIPTWAEALGPELSAAILAGEADDEVRREECSIRQRRAALRAHSTRSRWRHLAGAAGVRTLPLPTISVLLCTRRAEHVGFALAQIARQRHVDLEVVLTLHGLPAGAPAIRRAVAGYQGPVRVVEVPGAVPFGEALNEGARAAAGDYLAKWDDDDWYGPEFLADLMLAAGYSQADLVGCLSQFVYLEELNVTARRPGGESERFTAHLSGGTLLTDRTTFWHAGGFPPVARHVDTGLLRGLESAGGRIYRTHGLGYLRHRRAEGHTWDRPARSFLDTATDQRPGFRPSRLIEVDGIADIVGQHVRLDAPVLERVAVGMGGAAGHPGGAGGRGSRPQETPSPAGGGEDLLAEERRQGPRICRGDM